MLSRWQQLSLRDRTLLIVLGVALAFYLLYQVIWRPLATANANLRLQNAAAAQSLATVTQLAAEYGELKRNSAQNQSQGQNLAQVVDQTVAANNLHMSRFQPGSNGDVQVRLDNAPFDQVVRWLNQLEATHAVSIKEMAVAPGSGSGLVNVSVRLYRS